MVNLCNFEGASNDNNYFYLSYQSFPSFWSCMSAPLQSCSSLEQTEQLLSTSLPIIGLDCHFVQFCRLLGGARVEIKTWSRNTSISDSYLMKSKYLKYVDNKASEIFLVVVIILLPL